MPPSLETGRPFGMLCNGRIVTGGTGMRYVAEQYLAAGPVSSASIIGLVVIVFLLTLFFK